MEQIKLDFNDLLNLKILSIDNIKYYNIIYNNKDISTYYFTLIIKNAIDLPVLINVFNKLGYSSEFIDELSYSMSNCQFSYRWLIIRFYLEHEPDIFIMPKNIKTKKYKIELYTDVFNFCTYSKSFL